MALARRPNTFLKALCLVALAAGVVFCVLGVIGISTGDLVVSQSDAQMSSAATFGLSLGYVIAGLFWLLLGIFGLVGKFSWARTFIWVLILLSAGGIIASYVNGASMAGSIVSLVFAVAFLVGMTTSHRGKDGNEDAR